MIAIWRLAPILAALAVMVLAAPPAADAASGGCAEIFPGVDFELTRQAGPVTVMTADLSEGLADRFTADLEAAATLMQAEMGGLDGVEVCLFRDMLPLDAEALGWPVGQILRAASFAEQRAVALSTIQFRLVRPAGIIGLAHQAQWQVSDGSYPAVFGGAVAQWYRSRDAGRLESDHGVMLYARIIRAISEPIPWLTGELDAVQLWNPQFEDSPVGDFVEFVVDADGVGSLRSPDLGRITALDAEWQQRLLVEARGSERPSSGWIIGAAIIGGAVVAMFALAISGWRKKHRPG